MNAPAAWERLTLQRPGGLSIRLADLGATWLSCELPMPGGSRREVLLGTDDLAEHLAQRAYFGATVGRYANRIAGARYSLDGQEHRLQPNGNGHQLHGGPQGFDKQRWQLVGRGSHHAVFALHSAAGDQGFPGEVRAKVTYRLPEDGLSVEIGFSAQVSEPTPLALTNHAYFNLDGRLSDIRDHSLQIAGETYLPVDAELIPSGGPQPVAGTDFDFRTPHRIGQRFGASEQQRLAGGYDHAWVLAQSVRAMGRPAAVLVAGDGRVRAELFTDQPAVQVYTGNHLAGEPSRWGSCTPHVGVAIEPGLPPDSPNHTDWPSAAGVIARPGVPWHATIRWQFSTPA